MQQSLARLKRAFRQAFFPWPKTAFILGLASLGASLVPQSWPHAVLCFWVPFSVGIVSWIFGMIWDIIVLHRKGLL